jgi:hypothetical protein
MTSKTNTTQSRIDHSVNRLGKQPPRSDLRTLQLTNYLKVEALPAPPSELNYGKKLPPNWGMMGNNKIGDCTCAAAGHSIQEWSKIGGKALITIPDSAVLAAYEAVSGYNPEDPKTDRGANELDLLNYWRKTGIGGYRITAYVGLEPHNSDHVKDAIDIFGNCYIGLALPVSAQTQLIWTVPPGGPVGHGAPGSWGGHAVIVVGYDARTLTVVTWGKLQQMTWQFWDTYCDEAYGLLCTQLWKKNPVNLDVATLMADLQAVAQSTPEEWSIVAKHTEPKPPTGQGRWIPMSELPSGNHSTASSVAVLTRILTDKLSKANSQTFDSANHDGIWVPDLAENTGGYPMLKQVDERTGGHPMLYGERTGGYPMARYIA